MVKKLSVFLLLFLMPALAFANSLSDYSKWVEEENRKSSAEIETLLTEGDINKVDRMIHNAESILSLASGLKNICEIADSLQTSNWRYRTDYSWCFGYFRVYASQSAALKLIIAKFCISKGLKDKAKEIYREIITTYTGDAYRSYAKQAEFGLDDIRLLELKEQQEAEAKAKQEAEAKAKQDAEQGTKKTTRKKK